MKKLLFIFTITAMLCGCGDVKESAESSEVSLYEAVTEEENEVSDENVYIDEDRTIFYDTLDEFRSSEFYSAMKSEGVTPYVLSYDEERYSMGMITSDPGVYKYVLYDNLEQQDVRYSVSFTSNIADMNELQETFSYAKNILTTAENNGITYEVYLTTPPYQEEECYGLIYLPFENCKASIHTGNDTTTDEILSYFDDFVLVPDESQAAQ